MRRLLFISSLFLAFPCFAATYDIDPDHSSVGFKIRHLAISHVAGNFTDFKGTFVYDPADVKASKAEAVVSAKSINTQQTKRDDHLRSPDFFDAAQFPNMKFVSKGIKNPSPSGFDLEGDLTIHGVTKPVTFKVEVGGTTKDMYGKERAAFSAQSKINRKDFGLAWSKLLETGQMVVGDEVTIMLDIEGVKQG